MGFWGQERKTHRAAVEWVLGSGPVARSFEWATGPDPKTQLGADAGKMGAMENETTLIGTTSSPEETKTLACALATCLRAGDVVLLSGDLGAGKTQFTQGLAAGLGAADAVISPTFNIVLTYGSGRLPLHHFDLYRLDSAEQLEDIGLREYLESDGVCVVEWAEKFPAVFDEYLAIEIRKASEDVRLLSALPVGIRAEELLAGWTDQLAFGNALSGKKLEYPTNSAVAHDADGKKTDLPTILSTQQLAEEKFAQVAKSEIASEAAAIVGNSDFLPIGAVEQRSSTQYVLAFDTANEVVALGVGKLAVDERRVDIVATREIQAHRASNTTLVPAIDELLGQLGISRSSIACVCVGRGPGSFTGVRIAMATAKGIASALGVALVGVSTLDAIAWNAQAAGVRGDLLVVADAMRKEVYPARFALFDDGVRRLGADRVVKADAFAVELDACPARASECEAGSALDLLIAGDGLVKYRELYEGSGRVLDASLWESTGRGLLLAFQDAWQKGDADPLDAARHDPGLLLPVYTRLSDAEENERIRLANDGPKNLETGVQDVAPDGGKGRSTMHAQAHLTPRADAEGVAYQPLDAAHAPDVALLEAAAMGTDAWNADLVAGELGQRNRTWWVAEADGALVGYAGGLVVDGDLQILKVAVAPSWRRHGIARELIVRIAEDARNLGASTCSLEVRASNEGAQAFYASLGLENAGKRPRYYSDREDAVIMAGPLPVAQRDVAGMELQHLETSRKPGRFASSWTSSSKQSVQVGKHPLILAIESSCDETAAAVVDGEGSLLSDVVASQIDFHARFGGVVPEIASRKHIEAICGVCAEALDVAQGTHWRDLDAIAVTYAPGLLGALVVGVAFGKAAAWALDVPFIGVNHLEGHLYANKIGEASFAPPAVVSLVSGGNTMLVHMRDWGDYVTLGATIDDAVGEAFDKVSKALGLGYPGGPAISREAKAGNPAAIDFPRAMLHSHDLRFSLSGLKTAVVNYINGEREAGRKLNIPDIAASFQQAVVDVQVAKAKTALQQTCAPTFCLGGGVAANPVLRAAYEKLCADMGVKLVMPPLASCGDNAGMIALAALDRYYQRKFFPLSADAQAHASLDEPY